MTENRSPSRSPLGRILVNLLMLSFGTFVSRILGFVREVMNASFFGTSKDMDAFNVALRIPTLFRRILAEDVVERAFLPPFKQLMTLKREKEAWALLWSCFNLLGLALIGVCLLCYLLAPQLVALMAPGLDIAQSKVALISTYVVLPFMVLIGLASYVGGLLMFFEKNAAYSLAPAFLSLGIIVAVPLLSDRIGIHALSAGFVLGGALQFLVQIPFARRCKGEDPAARKYTLKIAFRKDEGLRIGREFLFIAGQSLVSKSVEIVESRLASRLRTGSLSALGYANRLIQLPFAIFGLAIGRAVSPYLTERASLAKPDEFKEGVLTGVRLNLIIFLPLMSLLMVHSRDIVAVVYQRGQFSQESTILTGNAFAGYSLGLLGMGLLTLFTRALSTVQRNLIPLLCSAFACGVNVLLDYWLVKTPLAHAGLALATSIGYMVNAVLLALGMRRWLKENGTRLLAREMGMPLIKLILLTLVATGLGWAAALQVPLLENAMIFHVMRIAVFGMVMGGVYLVLLIVFPVQETRAIRKKIWAAAKRSGS